MIANRTNNRLMTFSQSSFWNDEISSAKVLMKSCFGTESYCGVSFGILICYKHTNKPSEFESMGRHDVPFPCSPSRQSDR